MTERIDVASYAGQVEMDPTGALWAVLYLGETVLIREQVRSLRKGKRRVADLVLSAADSSVRSFRQPAQISLNRIVNQPARVRLPMGVAAV